MSDVFLEVIVNAVDAASVGIDSRDEFESPLEDALLASGVGEVTGGGGGSGVYIVDVEIATEDKFEKGLAVIRGVLQKLNVPASTLIKRRKPKEVVFSVYI